MHLFVSQFYIIYLDFFTFRDSLLILAIRLCCFILYMGGYCSVDKFHNGVFR